MAADGTDEINSLTYLPFEQTNDGIKNNSKLVLVLVEERLLNTLSGSSYSSQELLNRLKQYKTI